jgi:phosphofructokinase-like protein
MSQISTIAISTGGGDCPGLNAVIRAATRAAILQHGWKVLGIEDGLDGLIWPQRTRELTLANVSGILPRGGTILGTTNRGNPFRYCVVEGGTPATVDFSARLLDNARQLGIDALIMVGGDGTQTIGLELGQKGMKIVGVPKTIDNDLQSTDVTFGFDTALHTAADAIDKIHTTAESHHRIMLVELMGREAGWIALEAGLAGGAHIILIPEIPFSIEKIAASVEQRQRSGKRFTVVAVAEGVKLPAEIASVFERERRAAPRPGSVGNVIAEAIAALTRREVRVTVLGHIQRGGSPSPFDRILGTRFGVAAVELIAEGKFGYMVSLRGSKVVSVPIAEACCSPKFVNPEGEMVRTARAIGISFGD